MYSKNPPYKVSGASSSVALTNAYLRAVYNWMGVGLLATALTAYAVANTQVLHDLVFYNTWSFIGIIAAELFLVFYISGSISKLSAGTATGLFLLYSVLNGATLSVVLLAYNEASIYQAFFSAAGMFAVMSLYGLITKRSLTSLGSFCIMGLFGLLIAMIINIFWPSSMLNFMISCVGIVVFLGLSAYDTQRLRQFGADAPLSDQSAFQRGVILGALTLYLDFINLFIMMLRLIGDRR